MNDSVELQGALAQSAPCILNNKKIITFRGLADGTTKLNHEFTDKLFLNSKLKIEFVRFDWFTDASIWVVDAIYDNKLFTVNANTRYELTNAVGSIKLKYPLTEAIGSAVLDMTAFYNFLVNNNPTNLFNQVLAGSLFGQNLYNESWIPVNAYISNTVKSMDWIIKQTLINDIETGTTATPYVRVSMIVEVLTTEKSKYLEVGLNSL